MSKKIYLSALLIVVSTFLFAQNKKEIIEIKDTIVARLLKELQKTQDDTIRVDLLIKISKEFQENNFNKALEYSDMAIQISQEVKYKKGLGYAYKNTADVYSKNGDFVKAIDYYNKSLKIFNEYNKEMTSDIFYNMSVVYRQKAEYQKTMEYLLKTLKVAEKYKNTEDMAWVYNDMGFVYKKLSNLPNALEYYKKAYQLAIEIDNKEVTITSLNNIGNIYFINKEYKTALNYYNQSIAVSKKINDVARTANTLNNISSIYFEMKNYNKALEYLKNLASMYNRNTDKDDLAIAYTNIATVNGVLLQFDSALIYFHKSLELAEETGSKQGLLGNYQYLTETYKRMGNYKLALEYSELFNQMKDSIYNENMIKQTIEIDTKYQTEKKEKEIVLKNKNIELLEKDKKIKSYTLYGIVLCFLTSMIISFLWFRNYKQKQKVKEMQSLHQLELKMKEIDVLQENINRLITENTIPLNTAILNEDINQYLATPLSDRELGVLKELAQIKTNKEIADTLFVSVNTVKTHLLNIYEKLDVKNRNQALKKIIEFKG